MRVCVVAWFGWGVGGLCETFSKHTERHHLWLHYTHAWSWPGKPWARLHIDYAGLFEGKMLIDAYSN